VRPSLFGAVGLLMRLAKISRKKPWHFLSLAPLGLLRSRVYVV
jgi:hypothetical protein